MGFPAPVRFVLCLLLAVATALGGAAPVRACGCPVAARVKAEPPRHKAPARSCCKTEAKPGTCCATTACCTAHAPSAPVDGPVLGCTCDRPAAPSAPPAPGIPSAPDADEGATASPVPPLALELPADRLTAARPAGALPPTDLVISLSRLTC